ncbi:hypothetical protein F5X96DRAFT_676908 [Biscogniauxia mediterranea]|nr:hypothetical protein F5X96DRAFT_676908 [Biscogniauxia mediterranea]
MTSLCRRRLLHDLQDLALHPYPKIELRVRDADMTTACLVLQTDNYGPVHLTVRLGPSYPLAPPEIEMNSAVVHPNVYGGFICATILRRNDEYTPAYTLRGIAIQMLSFFDSERVEQEHGGHAVRLDNYRDVSSHVLDTYACEECGFGLSSSQSNGNGGSRNSSRRTDWPENRDINPYNALVSNSPEDWPSLSHQGGGRPSRRSPRNSVHALASHTQARSPSLVPAPVPGSCNIRKLPTEVILRILDYLPDFADVTGLARAWPRVSAVVRNFDVVRQRELQCFCLKLGYSAVDLGVGVAVTGNRRLGSEFDLLSREAFTDLGVRASVHNVPFQHWLPLPISRRHWGRVWRQGYVKEALQGLRMSLAVPAATKSDAHVLFTFMNDIVVRLNLVTEKNGQQQRRPGNRYDEERARRSAVLHASEKAIESYFHLFHLLVCLATEDPSIVTSANQLLERFVAGHRTKDACPNLGHLLVALLISDVPVTESLVKAIITEAITRNVVWLLDRRGSNMAELSFLEDDAVSAYRLDHTFAGSRTSYRLLMFSELFRRTAWPSSGTAKPLAQVRDELFDRHGAPPRGAAARLAAEVRRLHGVADFPAFMREMGLSTVPTPAAFTAVLRDTVRESMRRGYSKWALPRNKAMALRVQKDPKVMLTWEEREWLRSHRHPRLDLSGVSFFPNN